MAVPPPPVGRPTDGVAATGGGDRPASDLELPAKTKVMLALAFRPEIPIGGGAAAGAAVGALVKSPVAGLIAGTIVGWGVHLATLGYMIADD